MPVLNVRYWISVILPVLLASNAPRSSAVDGAGVNWPDKSMRATISADFDDSPLTVSVSSRTAGAIDSIKWKGHEFVNSSDHGREFQSAASFDGKGECFNPTEAGANTDRAGETSLSELLSLHVTTRSLETKTKMAYWIGPGGESKNCHGTVSTVKSVVSNDTLSKKVTIGTYGIPNVIEYLAIFNVSSPRTQGRFEAVTGYMPPEFSRFQSFDPESNNIAPLSDGPGDQALPIIFSTADGRYAIGVYSPKITDSSFSGPTYGRFRFANIATPTVKWNCFFRERVVAAGEHPFTCYIVVGSIDEVLSGLKQLDWHFKQSPGHS